MYCRTNYTLCPAVRVSDISRQMVAAVAWVWQHIVEYGGDPDRITVVGHSAGGQLVGMLLATDWLAVGRRPGRGAASAAVATRCVHQRFV